MDFKISNLQESSCGIGNFIGIRPEVLADSKIYGIELDGISRRIAQLIYQKSSIAVQGVEKTDLLANAIKLSPEKTTPSVKIVEEEGTARKQTQKAAPGFLGLPTFQRSDRDG